MKYVSSGSPQIRDNTSTKRIMIDVCIALLPATIVGCVLLGLTNAQYGIQSAILMVISVLSAVAAEFVFKLVTNGEFSAMCVLGIRGGKLQAIETYDILNYFDEVEVYSQFIMQYYSSHPLIAQEIILPNIETDEIELFLSTKSGKKITIAKPKIDSVKFKLLDMADQNARIHLEKNLD